MGLIYRTEIRYRKGKEKMKGIKLSKRTQFILVAVVTIVGVLLIIYFGMKQLETEISEGERIETEVTIESELNQEVAEREAEIEGLLTEGDEYEAIVNELEPLELCDDILAFSEFTVTNHEEYITPLVGAWGYTIIQGLYSYAVQYDIDTLEATCIGVGVNQDITEQTDFYMELGDTDQTILVVTYNPTEKAVYIQESDYTKEEILNEVWYYEDMPEVRDVEE